MEPVNRRRPIFPLACLLGAWLVATGCRTSAPDLQPSTEAIGSSLFDHISATEYFPLQKGNWWTYEGTAANAVTGGGEIEKPVSVTMRVVETVVYVPDAVVLSIMEGHPSDAAWALVEADRLKVSVEIRPKRYGYLLVSNKLFRIAEDKIASLTAALRDQGLMEPGMISEENLELEMPLSKGLRFGEFNQLLKSDHFYYWFVSDVSASQEPKGGRLAGAPLYTVRQYTLPDGIWYSFKPGVGIVSYHYDHHGTRAEVELRLTAFSVR
jgi:hypothetical protein